MKTFTLITALLASCSFAAATHEVFYNRANTSAALVAVGVVYTLMFFYANKQISK
jgi:hypothetical protein